jgi:hypothetical protein
VLCNTDDDYESKNLLPGGRILSFLNISVQKALLLLLAVIEMILFRL